MGSIPTRSRHPGPGGSRGLLLVLLVLLAPPLPGHAQLPEGGDAPVAEPPTRSVLSSGDDRQELAGPPVSPMGALLRSFVVPGWGQAAVGRPVRGAIYFAAEAASIFMVVKSQSKLEAARRGAGEESALAEARSQQREDWIVLSAFIALMSGVDAWVSAHLHGFEGQLEPPEDGSPGLQLRYRIPVRIR